MRILAQVLLVCLLVSVGVLRAEAQVAPKTAAPPAAADAEFARVEVHAGLGYGNLSSVVLASRKHSGGWGASVTYNATRYFGLTADFAGFYDPECSEQDFDCFLDQLLTQQIVDYSQHHFMAGPRFVAPVGNKRIFFHALVGGARTHSSIIDLNTLTAFRATAGPNFALGFGGGLDWTFHPRFAWRVIQVDSVSVHETPGWRNNLRFQTGVVIRLGLR